MATNDWFSNSMISLLLDRTNQLSEAQHARTAWSRSSMILSIGFAIGITHLYPITNNNTITITWIDLWLAFTYLCCQAVSRHLFSVQVN